MILWSLMPVWWIDDPKKKQIISLIQFGLKTVSCCYPVTRFFRVPYVSWKAWGPGNVDLCRRRVKPRISWWTLWNPAVRAISPTNHCWPGAPALSQGRQLSQLSTRKPFKLYREDVKSQGGTVGKFVMNLQCNQWMCSNSHQSPRISRWRGRVELQGESFLMGALNSSCQGLFRWACWPRPYEGFLLLIQQHAYTISRTIHLSCLTALLVGTSPDTGSIGPPAPCALVNEPRGL